MNNEGFVSLWVGVARSEEALQKFVETSFSDDGDFLGSVFSRAFVLGRYYDDLLEAEYHESPTATLRDLLRGASYEDVIIGRFEALGTIEDPVNCSILLCDCRHVGPSAWASADIAITFVGTVKYR
ncbi:MAG TPA: immunity 22 family protein [Polyangia bacterium]|nr:immunity 22 family protein [Polyangia bacterium]